MFKNGSERDTLLEDDALESLADLEHNKSDTVKRARSNTRIRIKSKVIAQPGNSGDRLKFKIQGVSGDISTGGCQILFPIPLRVGDIYWLTFDKTELTIDSVFARCLRCRLIREDAYEVGFKFFEPIDLSDAVEAGNTEALFG
ncbi:MAG: PilZ domain-containing protein [Planctomycetota bacterium]|nr:PilZ domain-containing protein [Planctomycetota bacterium]